MRPVVWAALVGAAVLSLVPVVTAEDAPPAKGTTVYLHLFGNQDMPMNPQPPPAELTTGVAFGVGTNSLACMPDTPGTAFNTDYHTLYGYSSLGPIEYSRGGAPDVHPDRGLLAAIPLADAKPVLHWYWVTSAVGTSSAPVPLANVVVHAVLRAGDDISVDNTAYNQGELLAEGQSQPAFLAMDASTGVEHEMVGNRHLYHFTIPLDVKAAEIPVTGYNLRIDTWMLRDECPGDGYFMPNAVSLYSDAEHRPRLELGVVEPPLIEALPPRNDNGTWTFDVRSATAWGGADIGQVTAELSGPSAAKALVVEDYSAGFHCHCDLFGAYASHARDTRITWDAFGEKAKAGDYVLKVTAVNAQGTATTTQEIPFSVGGQNDVPGIAPALLALALPGLALAARRFSGATNRAE